MTTHTAQEHLDAIGETLDVYQQENNQRLASLESKNTHTEDLVQKFNQLEEKVKRAHLASKRPVTDMRETNLGLEQKAFNAYIRKGDEAFLEAKGLQGS